tara:strand:+ start:22 stop:375 length:354 start_codon:yes stop_codon:yes gene_type:complete
MKYLPILLLFAGCSSPQKTLDLLTPDTFGMGRMNGTITGATTGWQEHYTEIHTDYDLDQESTILYLEWSLPEWDSPQKRGHDSTIIYLESRLRELEEQEARREAMVEAWLNELEKDV